MLSIYSLTKAVIDSIADVRGRTWAVVGPCCVYAHWGVSEARALTIVRRALVGVWVCSLLHTGRLTILVCINLINWLRYIKVKRHYSKFDINYAKLQTYQGRRWGQDMQLQIYKIRPKSAIFHNFLKLLKRCLVFKGIKMLINIIIVNFSYFPLF